jgi:hypothetical protein
MAGSRAENANRAIHVLAQREREAEASVRRSDAPSAVMWIGRLKTKVRRSRSAEPVDLFR